MGASPTYVPVVRTGVDVSFGDITATGNLSVAGTTTLSGALTGTSADFTGQLEVDGTAIFNGTIDAGTVDAVLLQAVTGGASDAVRVLVSGDTEPRFRVLGGGTLGWGPGGVTAPDTSLTRSGANALETPGFFAMGSGQSAGQFSIFGGAADSLRLGTAGAGVAIAEGANATSGVATLVAGTVTVNTNKVAANSRIQLTTQVLGTVAAPKAIAVTARVAGTSFTITSEDNTDTSQVAWVILSPA